MVTVELLREILNYDEHTGLFTRKVNRAKFRSGEIVGWRRPDGYRIVRVNNGGYLAHRLVWLYHFGEWPKDHLDHINGDRDDNRLANLREANRSQNGANAVKPKNNNSGFKGVSYSRRRNRWQAGIGVNGKTQFLGWFKNPEDASVAYQRAASFYFGEFARTH